MNQIKIIILAGGFGKRLWPLSRKRWPKFLLKFGEENSLLQQAYQRLDGLVGQKYRFIITNKSQAHLVNNDIKKINKNFKKENIISEPLSRNTAPAITLGLMNMDEDDIIVVLPADQLIEPKSQFEDTIKKAIEVAKKNYIVTIGIKPSKPATGYGYIKKLNNSIKEGFQVDEFKEKPDLKTAKQYVESGNYYWNAGIFIFKAGFMKKELKKYSSDIYELLSEVNNIDDNLEEVYANLPSESIDCAVMERSEKVAVVPFGYRWDDLGSWEAVQEVLSDKKNDLIINGEKISIDSSGSMIYTEPDKLTASIGVKDTIVVDTEDALLVMKRGAGQKVKQIVEKIKDKSQSTYHITDYRPWGGYKILDEGEGYKTKILFVDTGQRLSLQKHKYRDEIWTIIKGKGVVTLNDKQIKVKAGKTVKIPAGAIHRAENTGVSELKILELATGDKISEDDIIRLEDDYKRQ